MYDGIYANVFPVDSAINCFVFISYRYFRYRLNVIFAGLRT